MKKQPIENVQWLEREQLRANDYNPNRVMPPELELLKISILEDGWTQPIVARKTDEMNKYEIVDGFHRWTVAADKKIAEMTGGKIPVVILQDVKSDGQIMSTIRHNRARGSHLVVNMAHIVNDLVDNEKLSYEEIEKRLGMEKEEVQRLYDYGKMTKRGSKKDDFGKGWVPKHERSRY